MIPFISINELPLKYVKLQGVNPLKRNSIFTVDPSPQILPPPETIVVGGLSSVIIIESVARQPVPSSIINL